jgi:phospholipid/cholesterol/gamma-HCH transport system ATP-binding protein
MSETAPPGNNTIIRVEGLVKRFGPRTVLDGLTFNILRSQTTVILGGSGCGKSTLLKALVGYIKPEAGRILYDDQDIVPLDDDALDPIRRRFGILFQNGALLNSVTVGENVALPLVEHTDLDPKIVQMIVKMKLELVGLRGFENLYPSQISGGMRKRVGLARAIALDPEIVFYDEPSSGLDPVTAAVIDKLMMDLSRKLRITSVVVTHHMDSAFKIADSMIMLHQGRILVQGKPETVRLCQEPVVRQFIKGEADGPIPMAQTGDDYIKDLLGID